MLRLVALPMVNQLAFTRDSLVGKMDSVDKGEFVVTIGGNEREDDEVRRQVKPLLQRILRERIGSIDRDLGAYGVDTN